MARFKMRKPRSKALERDCEAVLDEVYRWLDEEERPMGISRYVDRTRDVVSQDTLVVLRYLVADGLLERDRTNIVAINCAKRGHLDVRTMHAG